MIKVIAHERRTLSWWFDERDNIDMAPVYQRRSKIWGEADKAYLVDSILNNFDIPKLYIADFTYKNTPLNLSRKPYGIIDGKQRFEAIFDFFEGNLVLDTRFIYDDDPTLRLGGLGLKDLKSNYPKIARKFENFNLDVASVITDDPGKINELFVRLNASKPLTGAEIRNAMKGKVPALFRDISRHPFFRDCIKFSKKRGQDLNAAAKLLLTEFRGEFVDTKKRILDRFVEEGVKSQSDEVVTAADRVKANLDVMREVFIAKDPLLSSQGALTVYYWLIKIMGDEYKDYIREFLVQFEKSRKDNRKISRQDPSEADPELLLYDNYSRSTNDQISLEARFRILTDRLNEAITADGGRSDA